MTVIAAVATDNCVVMGCDTRADYDGTAIYLDGGKIAAFTTSRGERVLISFAGAGAIVPVLTARLALSDSRFATPDPTSATAADNWAHQIAKEVTAILVGTTPPLTCDEGDGITTIDGVGLLAWDRNLWLLQTHTVFRPRTGVHALGSGGDIALGAMHAALNAGGTAEQAVGGAVRLACDFVSGCGVDDRGPLVYSTKGE